MSTARIPTSTSSPDGVAPAPDRPFASTAPGERLRPNRAARQSRRRPYRADSPQARLRAADSTAGESGGEARSPVAPSALASSATRSRQSTTTCEPMPTIPRPDVTRFAAPHIEPAQSPQGERECRTGGPCASAPAASTGPRRATDSRRARRRCERRRCRRLQTSSASPRTGLQASRRPAHAIALMKFFGIRHPAEDGALRLDHLEPDALELGEVRRDAVAQHDALVAAVVRLAHRRVHAHLERHAADDQRLDAAIEQDLVQVGGVKRALARLVDDRLARDRVELVDDVVALSRRGRGCGPSGRRCR